MSSLNTCLHADTRYKYSVCVCVCSSRLACRHMLQMHTVYASSASVLCQTVPCSALGSVPRTSLRFFFSSCPIEKESMAVADFQTCQCCKSLAPACACFVFYREETTPLRKEPGDGGLRNSAANPGSAAGFD